jgi:3-oxoacyl-[acyl-carrier-protein] synthase-3
MDKPNIKFAVYLPKKVLTNEDLEKRKIVLPSGRSLTAEGVREKIGVEQRHIAGNETVADMGQKAAKEALGDVKDVDFIIASTSHPTNYNLAGELKKRLNLKKEAKTLDIHAACSGVARIFASIYENGEELKGKKILIVAAEKFSHSLVDLLQKDAFELDRSLGQTIFGDGASAIYFTFGKDLITHFALNKSISDPGGRINLISMAMGDNNFVEPCIVNPVARSANHKDFPQGYFTQDGPNVYKNINGAIPLIIREAVKKTGFSAKDVDLIILHPGSKRMVDSLREALSPDFKVYSDYADGNISSVSLLLSFINAIKKSLIGKGSIIVLSGFGAGSPHLYSSTVVIELL